MRIIIFLSTLLLIISCSSKHEPTNVSKQYKKYYCDTYQQCRNNFLQNANKWLTKQGKIGKLSVPSKIDKNLNIDYLYLPALKRKQKIFIMSSGVHGIEGFMGSSVQNLFMQVFLPKLNRDNTGILLIHSVNPYGMKYLAELRKTMSI